MEKDGGLALGCAKELQPVFVREWKSLSKICLYVVVWPLADKSLT